MVTVITCVNNKNQYEEFCLPMLKETSDYLQSIGKPSLELIKVSHNSSIFSAYNEGIKKASFPIKVFIHQDVNLMNITWIDKIINTFLLDENIGLIGFVGTKKLGNKGFWWESGSEHIVGELYSGKEKANWIFNNSQNTNEVECIDGFFMATNKSYLFDENLTGFHFYDMDYSRNMRKLGHKIFNVNHKAWHIGEIRDQKLDSLWEAYNKKWNL